MKYRVVVTRPALQSLETIERKYHRAIRDAITENLTHEPDVPTRNRKMLDPAIFGATWELRCGPGNRYRVLYEILEDEGDEAGERVVQVLLFGEKIGAQLVIMGQPVTPLEEEL